MPRRREITDAERAFLGERLGPVLQALRERPVLLDEFLVFVQQRGGGIALTLDRLKTVWWPSRKSMYPGFFVLALADFGAMKGLYNQGGATSVPKQRRARSRSGMNRSA